MMSCASPKLQGAYLQEVWVVDRYSSEQLELVGALGYLRSMTGYSKLARLESADCRQDSMCVPYPTLP